MLADSEAKRTRFRRGDKFGKKDAFDKFGNHKKGAFDKFGKHKKGSFNKFGKTKKGSFVQFEKGGKVHNSSTVNSGWFNKTRSAKFGKRAGLASKGN